MIWGLARNAVVERKLREEAEITRWLATSGKQEEWGKVLPDMLALDESEAAWVEQETAIGFAIGYLGQAVPLLDGLVDACGALLKAPSGKLPVAAQKRVAEKSK
jgi:ABC-type protease/lipase transport system fused ATPase/permease subunit